MSNSEFAKRQLKKHGWKEGSGLGKEEHGRSEPIKVSLKMDKTGVGHDPGKEFTDHWWLRVFNEAAQKIGKKDKKSSKSFPSEEEKAKSKKEEQRKNFYKGFVQSSTLTNGVEEKNISSSSGSEDEESTNSISIPTLEDIHKFCGGATGHRAASFGIKMEGKIKRASHHEKQFEERAKSNGLNSTTPTNTVEDKSILDSTRKRKKKKNREKDKCHDQSEDVLKRKIEGSLESEAGEAPPAKHKKRKKCKDKRDVCGIELESEQIENTANSDFTERKDGEKKKKKKKKCSDGNVEEVYNSESKTKRGKKKKKKKSHE